jgi:hypothetical protein
MRTDEVLDMITHTLADKRMSPDAARCAPARAAKAKLPPVYYMATGADGVIPDSESAGVPVSLADAVGQTIEHPTPCQNLWYTETRFSYFEAVSKPGEALTGLGWLWPVRLWIVEPLGVTGNWGGRHYSYRLLSHRLRVVEETDATLALGPQGQAVIDLLARIPDLAQQWAADCDADPDSMFDRLWAWRLYGSDTCTGGDTARAIATSAARRRKRTAALSKMEFMAGETAKKSLPQASDRAQSYAWGRASNLAVAVLMKDALTARELDALRGVDLDQPAAPARSRT